MKHIIIYIVAVIAVAIISIYLSMTPNGVSVGAALPVAGQSYTLAGSGLSSSATSFTLTSFTIPQSGALINDSQISDTFYMTIEPGSRARQEIVGCTTVTQNGDGTATISGCTRGLSPMTPYTASTSLQFAHSGGSQVIISNPPQLYEQVGFLSNDEAITGAWTAITPTANSGIATKGYVDGVVNGGTVSHDNIAITATAGDTFGTGTIVYYDSSQQRWEKADASATTTSTHLLLGIAQGAGTDGAAISGGVLTRGYDTTQTEMTAGNTIYLSDTAGATSSSAGTVSVILGIANSATTFYFDPVQLQYANLAGRNDFTGQNFFTTATTTFNHLATGIASTSVKVITSSSTWTKPAGLEYIILEMVGGGGGGGGATGASDSGGGGGGGGYCKSIIPASSLANTVVVTVGGKGSGVSELSGTSGQSTVFEDHATATGGSAGGVANNGAGGAGGTCTGGQIGISGQPGRYGQPAGTATDFHLSGRGGSTPLGYGGQGRSTNSTGSLGGNNGTGYGSGGSGAVNANSADNKAGGNGTDGVVIIYEVF